MQRRAAEPVRKAPRQRRAQTTTAAILEAAAQVFEAVGLERATTNRIAEVAGVSIGTLYQYYPSKETLVAALFERESDRHTREFLGVVERLGVRDVQLTLEEFLERMLAIFDERRGLYRVLLEELPRVAGLEPTYQIDLRVIQSVRVLLEFGRDRIDVEDLDIAAELVVRAVRYTTIVHLREPYVGDRRRALVRELSTMIARYLFGVRGLDRIA